MLFFISMSGKKKTPKGTMTELLRQALLECDESYRAIERATGIKNPSLVRFARGDQSLRLDLADKLAEYFGIECERREE